MRHLTTYSLEDLYNTWKIAYNFVDCRVSLYLYYSIWIKVQIIFILQVTLNLYFNSYSRRFYVSRVFQGPSNDIYNVQSLPKPLLNSRFFPLLDCKLAVMTRGSFAAQAPFPTYDMLAWHRSTTMLLAKVKISRKYH